MTKYINKNVSFETNQQTNGEIFVIFREFLRELPAISSSKRSTQNSKKKMNKNKYSHLNYLGNRWSRRFMGNTALSFDVFCNIIRSKFRSFHNFSLEWEEQKIRLILQTISENSDFYVFSQATQNASILSYNMPEI